MTKFKTLMIGVCAMGAGVVFLSGCKSTSGSKAETGAAPESTQAKVANRDYPSVFQAWNPVDMPDRFPLKSNEQRLAAAVRHDLIWEEPVSQLGYGVDLVLGAVWDHQHGGLATDFTPESKAQALKNRAAMLKVNPNMVFLMEVRWRDAPGSFLPENSPFWKRNADGTRTQGWDGGPEPYYLLNPDNPDFAANIARQSKISIESGIYDGIMLDWSGHLPIVKKVREVIGDTGLIIVNIHDNIEDGERYAAYINGSFMECNPDGPGMGQATFKTTWDKLRDGLVYFEENLRKPRINCLEVWGDRLDKRRMRATTTLGLTHSDGYVLFADPNPLKTPDHLHDWYTFWDAPLGKPLGRKVDRPDGAAQREFEGGTVVYNHFRNQPVTVEFKEVRRRVSDGTVGKRFLLQDYDGDIFLKL